MINALKSLVYGYIEFVLFRAAKPAILVKIKKFSHEIQGLVLDIGAGQKPYEKLFTNASRYISTNSAEYYSEAEKETISKTTDYWVDDPTVLPFDDAEFDGIVCFQVLSCVHDPREFFQETHRILKPGGRLLLTTDFVYPGWAFYRYSKAGLEELVSGSGLKIIRHEAMCGVWTAIYNLIVREVRYLPLEMKNIKSRLGKTVLGLRLLLYLIFLPLISLFGISAYFLERGRVSEFWCAFNHIVLLEKPTS